MFQNLIKNYVDKLTIKDIDAFALKNEVILSSSEKENILKIIKDNWYDLIYGDYEEILSSNRNSVSEEAYLKILVLAQEYKKRYQSLL